jgi:hypothetical protein
MGWGLAAQRTDATLTGPTNLLPQVTSIRNGGAGKPGRGAPVDLPGLAARSLQQVRRNGSGD